VNLPTGAATHEHSCHNRTKEPALGRRPEARPRSQYSSLRGRITVGGSIRPQQQGESPCPARQARAALRSSSTVVKGMADATA